MINSIIFSKKTMSTHGTLVISIPPEIIEDMELSGGEMVEVRLTKKLHVHTTDVSPINYLRRDIDATTTIPLQHAHGTNRIGE